MKKNYFTMPYLKGLMIALMLCIVGNAWADTKTEGFESAATSTSYQGTVTIASNKSDCGIGWSIYYGTVSTSSKISGSNSAALRLYTSNNYGYLKTTTAIDNLTKVALKAKAATSNSAAIKVNVSYSSNGTDWTAIESDKAIASSATDYSWDIPSGGKYFQIAISSSSTKPSSGSVQLTIDDVVFTYASATTTSAPTLTSSTSFTSESMDVTITNNESGATVYYTTDGSAPTTSSTSFTGASKTINITATTTVKAMAVISGKSNSAVSTATYTKEVSIANTAATAYTVTEAKTLIDANSSQLSTTQVYIKGTVSKVDNFNDTYGSITYWLDSDAFEIYGGLNNNGAKFTSIDDIKVGAEVIVYGYITKYDKSNPVVYETKQNSWLVSYTAPAATKNSATLTLGTYKSTLIAGFDDEYTVTYNGDGTVSVTSSDETVADAVIVDGTVLIEAKKAGTTTITVSAAETDNYYAVSKNYTLTVSAPPPAAELPFTFDGGKADIAEKTGMTQTGLSTDYDNSPKLKFDGAGDNVIINYASTARNVTYKIKGNSTTSSTVFDVLESADGKTYTTVHSFSGNVPSTATSYTDKLKSDSRYVKFVYTTKSGNVALGAITITNEKADPGLAFEQSTYRFFNYTEGLAVKATSSKGSTGAITYSVEEDDASALNFNTSTGSICAESDGTFTIKATIAETEDHKEATATCTVIFKSRPSANSIIVAETTDGKYYAMTNTYNDKGYIESVQIAKIGDKYYVGDNKDAISYCVKTSDGKTIIENMTGQYLQATAAKKVSFTDDEYEWTNDGTTLTAADDSHGMLRFNPSDPRFTTYTGTSGRNVQIVDINKVSYNMSYDRTGVTEGKYGTICLPYAVAADGLHGIEKCYTATVNGNNVTLEQVDALEAGKPYIFQANDVFITLDMSGTPATATTNGCLTGVFKDTKLEAGDYVMQTQDDVQGFYQVAGDLTLAANRAYIAKNNSNSAKALTISFEGETTAINAINALIDNTANIYDINGRKLPNLQKGINIVNGVKVLVK